MAVFWPFDVLLDLDRSEGRKWVTMRSKYSQQSVRNPSLGWLYTMVTLSAVGRKERPPNASSRG